MMALGGAVVVEEVPRSERRSVRGLGFWVQGKIHLKIYKKLHKRKVLSNMQSKGAAGQRNSYRGTSLTRNCPPI